MTQVQWLVQVRALSISSLTAGQEPSAKTSKTRNIEIVRPDANQQWLRIVPHQKSSEEAALPFRSSSNLSKT
jgi:hypothetical protein